MTTASAPSISVKDLGPVTDFEYTMNAPGLHIIKGRQGAGKTTILRTVELATLGRTDVTPTRHDGAKRGTATVAGKTIRIAKQVREEGDLDLLGLDNVDLSTLHSPKYKTADVRDRHRTAALVRLSGVEANASLFHRLLGGKEQFEKIVDVEAIKTDDMVDMCGKVKREIEKAAQTFESQHQTALTNYRAQADISEAVSHDDPHDESALQDAHTAAVAERSRMQTRAQSATEIVLAANEARQELDKCGFDPGMLSKSKAALVKAQAEHVSAKQEYERLEKELEAARQELARCELSEAAAITAVETAEQLKSTVQGWTAMIERANGVDCPSQDQLAEADRAVGAANAAITHGVRVREAIAAGEKAAVYSAEAKDHEAAAKRLRNAAHDTFDVLSEAIASIGNCPLSVLVNQDGDPRLVIKTDRSENEYFDELSESEKWEPIIRMAGGKDRLLVLSQEAYGGMNDSQRADLDHWAEECGCYIVTAQNLECDLHGERWE